MSSPRFTTTGRAREDVAFFGSGTVLPFQPLPGITKP